MLYEVITELGVRMALGADASSAVGLVLSQATRVVAGGATRGRLRKRCDMLVDPVAITRPHEDRRHLHCFARNNFV